MYKKTEHLFTIEEALKLVMGEKRMQKGLGESVIRREWSNIMGPVIAKHTTGLYLKGDTLLVYFNSSVVKNEFIYHREKAISLINEALGSEMIKDLVIK